MFLGLFTCYCSSSGEKKELIKKNEMKKDIFDLEVGFQSTPRSNERPVVVIISNDDSDWQRINNTDFFLSDQQQLQVE